MPAAAPCVTLARMSPPPDSSRRRSPAIKVRRAVQADVAAIFAVQKAAYLGHAENRLCTERNFQMQIDAFPEGQAVATVGGVIVGYAMSLIVHLDDDSPWHSYNEITAAGSFATHDPGAETLYGADISVHPEHRGKGVAQRLYRARRKIMKRFNLRRMVAGGRIPGYPDHAGRLWAEEYVAAVLAGELKDPALNAHIKAGYHVLGVRMGYLADHQSLDYATHLQMDNPDYNEAKRRIAGSPVRRPVRKIRVCAAQYQMRRLADWHAFENQVEFYVHTASEYHCHFLLFPELFTVQLFSLMDPEITPKEAISKLADMTPQYQDLLSGAAKRTGLFIIGGSHPIRMEDGRIRNVAHLFSPSGAIYTQDKLHITPNERKEYGIAPGEGIKVFETSHARIAIEVCYDVEFPELARLQVLAGAEVLFVPFSTDERKAYQRVRYTGQARAVENAMYVVMAGNVGNLPQVENFLINYGQAVICTPSDFPFPKDGIAAVAEPGVETVVISDLDLVALEEAREMGSVRTLRDRRPDLYTVASRDPVEVIRVV